MFDYLCPGTYYMIYSLTLWLLIRLCKNKKSTLFINLRIQHFVQLAIFIFITIQCDGWKFFLLDGSLSYLHRNPLDCEFDSNTY
ncbi:MAG: hypothetical protein ACI9XO_000247 [Paraglaciecola sp.]|jgi:hypothetical protein